MSSPSQPSGRSSTANDAGRPRPPRTPPRRRRRSAARPSKSSGFSTRSCSAILPPMRTRVGPAAEVLEDAELVLDLRAAGDEHERPLDVAEQLAEVRELLLEQQAGVGRKQPGDRLGRGVRAVGRAERVVDVHVAAVRELARVALVVLRLARVEARVLEHVDAVVREQLAQARGRPAPSRTSAGPPPSSAARGASRRGSPSLRGRGAAAASAATRGCACRRRPSRPSAGR